MESPEMIPRRGKLSVKARRALETASIPREFYGQRMEIFFDSLETPLGVLCVEAGNGAIRAISFSSPSFGAPKKSSITDSAIEQLRAYFGGELQHFSLPIAPEGTNFERNVWDALIKVPYASTCSYSDIANTLHNPKAIRAVGRANGLNPIAIVIPCHRIIGSEGSLTGYAGGLWRKRWLLDHEARIAGKILL